MSVTTSRHQNYVAGEWVDAVEGDTEDVINPATGETIAEVPRGSQADVDRAVEAAKKAFEEWRETTPGERSEMLLKLADALEENAEELIRTEMANVGKPHGVMVDEVPASADNLRFFAGAARNLEGKAAGEYMRGYTSMVRREPVGVVGQIAPWNYPLMMAIWKIGPALAAGNTIVLKPSEQTPLTSLLLAQYAGEIFPAGVLNVITGDGETGAALVDAQIDKLSFTGSVRTGRRIAEVCGRRLVPCTLELGGKDPMIVCADADLARAARGAVYGAFANSGQVCTSTERVYVVEDVADEFTRRVLAETKALRQDSTGEFDVGAIACPQQLEIIDAHVADAVASGARVLAGGRRNPAHRGLFYEPTVLDGVTHQMRIMREETFGPVLPIMRVSDEAEALRLANDTDYGLNASIFTGDRRRGVEMAKAIESGCVVVNDCMLTYGVPEAPFGGIKESGIGRVNGEVGLRSYCNVQSILIDRFGSSSEPLWFPYSARKLTLIQRAMKVLWGTPLGRLLS
jgi:betaine-aldehyde dehydrogenase